MARIRSVKPGFFASEDVSELPLRARLTWIGLWTHCDDHGRAKDNAKLIKAAVWALDDVSLTDVERDLNTLADRGRILRYQVDGKKFLAVTNWHHHQNVNRPAASKIPAPRFQVGVPAPGEPGHCEPCWIHENTVPPSPLLSDDSVRTHGTVIDDSPQDRNGKDRRGIGGEAPTAPRVRARELASTAHSQHAHNLVEVFAETCQQRPTASVRRKLARHVDELVIERWPDELIVRALDTWRDKGLDPSVLPSVANEVANRAPSRASPHGTDAKLLAYEAMKEPEPPVLRAIEGGSP